MVATSGIGVCNLLNFKSINFVDSDPDFDGNHRKDNCPFLSLCPVALEFNFKSHQDRPA